MLFLILRKVSGKFVQVAQLFVRKIKKHADVFLQMSRSFQSLSAYLKTEDTRKKIPLCTSRFFCFTKRMQKEAQRGTYITNIVKLFFEVGPVSQTHVTLFDENLMHTQRRRQAVASLSLGRNLQVIPQ